MKIEEMSLRDLALYVSDHLRKQGVDTVLTDGACVTIYTESKYLSYDLDLVPLHDVRRSKVGEILEDVGFVAESGYFKNPQTRFFIGFVPRPLAVGGEPVKEIAEVGSGDLLLKLLSPTDCVKDRLAAYYHWSDNQALQQALLVCRDQAVDLTEVQRWSESEGMREKFEEFRRMLQD